VLASFAAYTLEKNVSKIGIGIYSVQDSPEEGARLE
jgi:hypothetical protein